MRRNWIKFGLMLALAFLLLASLSACTGKATEAQSQLAKVGRGSLTVTVGADGNLSFVKDRKLVFGISGTIAEVNVEEGDFVTQGTVLARLDTTSLELAVRAAEVNLEIAANSYTKITYPYTYTTFALNVPKALADIIDAKRQVDKALEKLEIGLSFDQYWQVWKELNYAQQRLIEAEQSLAQGRGLTSGYISAADFWTIRSAQLGVEQAQVSLDVANTNLAQAVIVAPFDGVVAAVDIKEGDSLSTFDYATRTIIELVDPAKMELDAEVDEIDMPSVKLGQRAIISVDALPDVQIEGEVTSISPLATEESGLVLYKIKVSFEVPVSYELKAGMSATADIVVAERTDVLLVPSRAVGEDSQGNSTVQVMVKGKIEEKVVVTGISDGLQIEIVSGLNEGDTVVVERKASPSLGFGPGG
jgi:HlyD family secretion protein